MIDNCLGVTAIGLGITGVGLLSTIVAAPAVIGMEAVTIVIGLLRVVGNRAIKKMSLKIDKHEKIAMLAVSALNTISNLTSKASDDSISDEQYSLIVLEFETFTWMIEDLRIKYKTILEKTGNMETEASVLFNLNTITIPTWTHVRNRVQNHVQNSVQTHVQNRVQNQVQNRVQNHVQNCVRNHVRKIKKICNKNCNF